MTAKTSPKGVLQSKTMWFGAAVSALGVLQLADKVPWSVVAPGTGGLVTIGIGLAIGLLRWVTTQPVQLASK